MCCALRLQSRVEATDHHDCGFLGEESWKTGRACFSWRWRQASSISGPQVGTLLALEADCGRLLLSLGHDQVLRLGLYEQYQRAQGVLEAMHRGWTVWCYRSRTRPLYTVVRSVGSLAAARHADCGWLCMDHMLVPRLGVCRHVCGPKRVEWTNSASPWQALRAGLLHAMLPAAGSCFPWTRAGC